MEMLMPEQGWENTSADDVFHRRRENADQPSEQTKAYFFKMMTRIAEQLDGPTYLLNVPHHGRILDLCAAPGGFLQYLLMNRHDLIADAISLSVELGGHSMLLGPYANDGQLNLQHADVTMFASELGCPDVPTDYVEYDQLQQVWPFACEYDLVICDVNGLRGHVVQEYRQGFEHTRLFAAQLSIALRRIREGGTILILIHQVGKSLTFSTICQLATFSEVTLIKPTAGHALKSSFYVIARRIRRNPQNQAVLAGYRKVWEANTIGMISRDDLSRQPEPVSKNAFDGFIDEYKSLVRGVIDVQVQALDRMPWTKANQNGIKA